jgi:hypothetical protein
MERPAQPNGHDLIDSADRGNVRISLHRYTTADGAARCLIELKAFNAWADQWKILHLFGGLQEAEARSAFESLTREIRVYSWEEGDYIPDGQ